MTFSFIYASSGCMASQHYMYTAATAIPSLSGLIRLYVNLRTLLRNYIRANYIVKTQAQVLGSQDS